MEIITRAIANERGLKFYFTGRLCKNGHVAVRRTSTCICSDCHKELNSTYKKNNPDKANGSQEQNRVRNKRYRDAHPERRAKTNRKYLINNRDKVREYQRGLKRRLRAESPDYRFKCNLRGRLHKAVTRNSGSKSATTMELIGCTIAELRAHLECQFVGGMTWENYGHGNEKWNIDHIVPCASFDLSNPQQQRQCFHFSNLRPLWHMLNVMKGDRLNVLAV